MGYIFAFAVGVAAGRWGGRFVKWAWDKYVAGPNDFPSQ